MTTKIRIEGKELELCDKCGFDWWASACCEDPRYGGGADKEHPPRAVVEVLTTDNGVVLLCAECASQLADAGLGFPTDKPDFDDYEGDCARAGFRQWLRLRAFLAHCRLRQHKNSYEEFASREDNVTFFAFDYAGYPAEAPDDDEAALTYLRDVIHVPCLDELWAAYLAAKLGGENSKGESRS